MQFLQSLTRPVCFFLDGIDELDPKESQLDLIELIERLNQQGYVKIGLASRPERAYQQQYRIFPTIRLQNLTETDMSHYVGQEVKRYMSTSKLSNNHKRSEDFVKLIVDKAQGVFLWAYLVIRSLRQGTELRNDDWDILTRRVEMKPSDLNDLYHEC